ncbi:tRNA dihydrouridine synthase DusB [Teredinibacter turnerae]|uniref:tRNA dihydrouridine synthase DusB n=1 Tax=Teredinibacter turnerae TaxID=2426 RepID=UPI0030D33FAB
MFHIGNYAITSIALLAPMAGVTDAPFRRICREMGAGLATSEMVTSDVNLWQSRKTRARLSALEQELAPVSVQIAGSEPQMMAQAAVAAVAQGAQIVDINMGCPAKKVCKKAAGSALLRDEALVDAITRTVVEAVDVPVTLKIRTGWDTSQRNAINIARIAENNGIQALAVHGRTRACRFNGTAEYDTIAQVVNSVAIPVIANGDIDSPAKARMVLQHTGAQAVMIGRAALGNPWLFGQIEQFLEQGEIRELPATSEVCKTIERHLTDLTCFYGEEAGVRIARKHTRWYLQGYRDAETFLKHFNTLNTLQSQLMAVRQFLERSVTHEENAA